MFKKFRSTLIGIVSLAIIAMVSGSAMAGGNVIIVNTNPVWSQTVTFQAQVDGIFDFQVDFWHTDADVKFFGVKLNKGNTYLVTIPDRICDEVQVDGRLAGGPSDQWEVGYKFEKSNNPACTPTITSTPSPTYTPTATPTEGTPVVPTETVTATPPVERPEPVQHKDCTPFGDGLSDLEGTAFWADMQNTEGKPYAVSANWAPSGVVSSGHVKLTGDMPNGIWLIWIQAEKPLLDENNIPYTQPRFVIKKTSEETTGLSTEAFCEDMTGLTKISVTPIIVGVVYSEYAHFEGLTPDQTCDVYAGNTKAGEGTVLSSGELNFHSKNHLRAVVPWSVGATEDNMWRVENCHAVEIRAIKVIKPFVPTLPTQKCDGDCPPAVCLLGPGKVVSVGFSYLGVDQNGQPEWFETQTDAESAGLSYVGEECSPCMFWAVHPNTQTAWFGPSVTESDLAIAIAAAMGWDSDRAATAAHQIAVEYAKDPNGFGRWITFQ